MTKLSATIFLLALSLPLNCIAQETAQTETAQTETAQREVEQLKAEVCVKLEALLKFKDKKKFKQFGFGRGGPYYKWLEGVEKLRDAQPKGVEGPISFQLKVAPGELMQVGLDYMQNGKETDYTKRVLPELKSTIGYDEYLAQKKLKKYVDAVTEERTWTDSTGEFTVLATLISYKGDTVTLKKKQGNTISLRVGKLSSDDKKLLDNAYPDAPKLIAG